MCFSHCTEVYWLVVVEQYIHEHMTSFNLKNMWTILVVENEALFSSNKKCIDIFTKRFASYPEKHIGHGYWTTLDMPTSASWAFCSSAQPSAWKNRFSMIIWICFLVYILISILLNRTESFFYTKRVKTGDHEYLLRPIVKMSILFINRELDIRWSSLKVASFWISFQKKTVKCPLLQWQIWDMN